LAEEIIWLKEKAGADVAERWYEALLVTLRFIAVFPEMARDFTGFSGQPGISVFLQRLHAQPQKQAHVGVRSTPGRKTST
jgi:plasmid stabilization system protein ParE